MLVDFQDHWLRRWMSEFEISSGSDFDAALRSGTAMKALHTAASESSWKNTVASPAELSGYEVLASRKFDLSGFQTCICPNCFEGQLQDSLVRSLPYFDRVVYDGPNAGHFAFILGMPRKREYEGQFNFEMRRLRSLVSRFDSISKNSVIAESVAFAPKPYRFCPGCEAEQAEKYHVPHEGQGLDELRGELTSSRIETLRDRTGRWQVRVDHPRFDRIFSTSYRGKRPTKRQILDDFARGLVAPVVADLAAASRHQLPLLDGFDLKGRQEGELSPSSVALHLNLPVLRDIDLSTFAELKKEYEPSYKRFQNAIRAAVQEQHESGIPADGDDAARIAKRIMEERIEPELQGIKQSLEAMDRSLERKLTLTGGVGAVVTAVGLFGSPAIGISAGIAAVMAAAVHANKRFDDKSEIEKHDLHFLWELDRRSSHG